MGKFILKWKIIVALLMFINITFAQTIQKKASIPKNKANEMITENYNKEKTIRTEDLPIRDPFIYVDQQSKIYYLYRSGIDTLSNALALEVYTSTNLKEWNGPHYAFIMPQKFWAKEGLWAPEIHKYKNKYYLFVTFTSKDTLTNSGGRGLSKRGTQILVADSPRGPFNIFDNRSHTPSEWMALDGTFYVDDHQPYMVFCHEWIELGNATIEAVKLKPDLSAAKDRPFTLFKALDAPWVKKYSWSIHSGYVTDGPFLYKAKDGKLLMIWSSYQEKDYAIGIAVSESGKIAGPWKQQKELLFKDDGGHGMIFTNLQGELTLVLHQPNSMVERMKFLKLEEKDGTLVITGTQQ